MDKRYIIHPFENIILRQRKQPKNLRTHYQVKNGTKMGKDQKVSENITVELEVERYPKQKRNKN